MIVAVDTSSLVAFLSGESGRDVDQLDEFLELGTVVLPPVVLVEILSDPKLPAKIRHFIERLPVLEILDGYWLRAAKLRASILARCRKARLGDALIAQSCIDHRAVLITRDSDFRHYVNFGALNIAK